MIKFLQFHNACAYLLQLELDGSLQLLDLGDHVVTVSDHGRELTGFVQTGAQDTGNLREPTQNDADQ